VSSVVSAALLLQIVVQQPLAERHAYGADMEQAAGPLAETLRQEPNSAIVAGGGWVGAAAYYLMRVGVTRDRFVNPAISHQPIPPEVNRLYVITEAGRPNAMNNTVMARSSGVTLSEWTPFTRVTKYPYATIWSIDRRSASAPTPTTPQ
jgi:hypothetical protein